MKLSMSEAGDRIKWLFSKRKTATRRTGYFVRGNDWPADVLAPSVSPQQLYRALDRMDPIFDDALEDLRKTPLPPTVGLSDTQELA